MSTVEKLSLTIVILMASNVLILLIMLSLNASIERARKLAFIAVEGVSLLMLDRMSSAPDVKESNKAFSKVKAKKEKK